MMPQKMSMMFIIISMMSSIYSFMMFTQNKMIIKMTMIELNSAQMNFELMIDYKLMMFISIVSFITSNIMLYSQSYMMSDNYKKRFTMILSMFALSMIWTMMTSSNMMSMLIGWDFLGLTSFLLIIHYQSEYVYNYGLVTFIMNRIGDICFIITGTLMFNLGIWTIYIDHMNMILMFLLFAAFTKSAQLPFSSWLPKAMAAPTPVSALVHSSTLVTAGVILLIRIEPMLINENMSNIFMMISTLSMMVGSICAMVNYDLKKIIAFSTLSQISFMMVILLMGELNLAFFHLLTHALFKSLMFMSAGTIIHHSLGEQDIRKINMLSNWLPLELTLMNLSMMALMGFPFYSGFFSKDMMIEYSMKSELNIIIIIMLDLSICLTSFYSSRLSMYLCWNKSMKMIMMNYMTNIQEKMIMIIFFIPIIMSGSMLMWMFTSMFIMENPLPMFMKTFGIWGMLMTMILMYFMIKMQIKMKMTLIMINSLMFIDKIIPLMIKKTLTITMNYIKFMEMSWNNFISIKMINSIIKTMSMKKMFSPWLMMKIMIIMIMLLMMMMIKMI